MKRSLLMLCLVAWAGASAAEPRPFTRASLAGIEQSHADRPFVLALWSVACGACLRELRPLGEFARRHGLAVELVATDGDAAGIGAALRQAGWAEDASWVFDDPVPERLQYAIDPGWRGELPRSYLYDAGHGRVGVSGLLEVARLEAWWYRLGRGDER